MATKLRIGILGTCPVCEGEFKTKNQKMVHHGYRRPGDGEIHDDCFGVGSLAYEVSDIGCKSYKSWVDGNKCSAKKQLDRLPEATHISRLEIKGSWSYEQKHFAIGVTPPHIWEREINRLESELKHKIQHYEWEEDRMTRLIMNWVEKPLREVTEAVAQALVKAEREKRAAERQAKRDEIAAKARALKEKRRAKEELRKAHVQSFVDSVKALREAVVNKEILDGRGAARALVEEFRSKKNERKFGYIWLHKYVSLQDREAFVMLNMTHENGSFNF